MRNASRSFCSLCVLVLSLFASDGMASAEADGVSAAGPLTSPYGIPGQVPVGEVWQRLLDTANLQDTAAAMKVVNTLFDDEGNLDPAACKRQTQAVRAALREIPISAGLWLYGGRCADLNGDSALAEQSEQVLMALLEYALKEREVARHAQPIRVLGENDVYAILDLSGEKILHQFYETPVDGRHMRLTVTLYDDQAGRESVLYFDFLDSLVQLARDEPDLAYPDGRALFAQSLLEGMAGSPAADIAREIWSTAKVRDSAERKSRLLAVGKQEGNAGLLVGMMCVAAEPLNCAAEGVEMLLPYAEADFADAYIALAAAYAEGLGVDRDESAARDLLAAANEEVGAPMAELGLQTLLRTVREDKRLHPLVAEALRAAAGEGHPIASHVVAQSEGDWSTTVPAEAVPLLQRASSAGIAEATGMLGRHHLEAGDVETGIGLLRAAAEAGDRSAAAMLGASYAEGTKLERDGEQARHWLNLAAQDGHEASMRLLAAEYERLEGPENRRRVDRWLSNATVRGDMQAAHRLARYLADEPEGVEQAGQRAVQLYSLLIEHQNSDEARVGLALWHLSRKNKARAADKAAVLLEAAAKNGDRRGRTLFVTYSMLGLLPDADHDQARRWLEEGLEGEDAEYALTYGSLLLYAQPKDRDVARGFATLERWWREKDSTLALNELAWARCTSSRPDIFDAEQALVLGTALAAAEATSREPAWLDTVAACQAASGQFAEAVSTQTSVLAMSEERLGPRHPIVERMRDRLTRYQAGEPFSEHPFPEAAE